MPLAVLSHKMSLSGKRGAQQLCGILAPCESSMAHAEIIRLTYMAPFRLVPSVECDLFIKFSLPFVLL